MRQALRVPLVLLASLVLLTLAACGSKAAIPYHDIPIYSNAIPMESGTNSMADLTAETFRKMVGDKMAAEVNLYQVPTDTTWDSVKGFYHQQLAKGEWKYNPTLSEESDEQFKIAAWGRGGGLGKEQVLLVGLIPNAADNETAMIVGLFSQEK